MRRIHAFEFEDLSWFPKNFRNYGTDFLQFGANAFDIYECVIPVIKKGIESGGNDTIVDIASGGGGGLVKISEHLKKSIPHLKIILSDYYPNIDAFKRTKAKQPDVFEYVEESVNAMKRSPVFKGISDAISFLTSFQIKRRESYSSKCNRQQSSNRNL